MSPSQPSSARRELHELLREPRRAHVATAGYLDALPADAGRQPGIAQRAMHSVALPAIYERLWRPVLFTLYTGRTTTAETNQMLERLAPAAGERMLDIACGPGNTTRRLADHAGPDGLVAGLDYASGMLERAVADTPQTNVAYLRGDALDLPFPEETFDVISCFGALYMLPDPGLALREMARVLKPGGRIAVLTASTAIDGPLASVPRTVGKLSGFNLQRPRFVRETLELAGLVDVDVDSRVVSQLVSARRPS